MLAALALPNAAGSKVIPYVAGDPGGGNCFEQYCWDGSQWYPCGYDCH